MLKGLQTLVQLSLLVKRIKKKKSEACELEEE